MGHLLTKRIVGWYGIDPVLTLVLGCGRLKKHSRNMEIIPEVVSRKLCFSVACCLVVKSGRFK
jgi:hypothetical protein